MIAQNGQFVSPTSQYHGCETNSWNDIAVSTSQPKSELVRRYMSATSWNMYYDKGKDLMEALDARLKNSSSQNSTIISEATLKEKLEIKWKTLQAKYITTNPEVKDTDKFYEIRTELLSDRSLYYDNFYSPRLGIIIASSNENKGIGNRIPWNWSSLVGYLWRQACAKDGIPTSNMKMVLQNTITNADTQRILIEAFRRSNIRSIDEVRKTYTRSDDAFYAIIGTPNGKGVPWLLRELADRVSKTVMEITVVGWLYDPTDPTFDLEFVFSNQSWNNADTPPAGGGSQYGNPIDTFQDDHFDKADGGCE